jgi:hypothetical protein
MLQELSDRLSKAIEQKRLKEKLERDLRLVKQEIQERSTEFASISKQLEKEKVDVEKLEHTSLTALFYAMLGNREEQLEKERQELLSAQLLYKQTKKQLEYLERKQDTLLQHLGRLTGIEAKYQALLSEKEQFLRQTDKVIARELVDYVEEIAKLNVEVREITEAITAGNDVISSLEQVIKSLESAESWGTWDILGGGLLTTAIKHSRIDDAQNDINIVQRRMSQFTRELADIRQQVELGIDLGAFESFADYFFDGLIVDWVIQSKISASLDRSKQAKQKIVRVVKELEELKKNVQNKQRELQAKRVQIIEST